MRFIDAVNVLAGRELRGFANMLCTIVYGPVVKGIGCRAGCSSGAGGRAGRCLNRLRSRGDRAHTGAVISDGIVDGHFGLFPDGEEVFVGLLFIGRNLSGGVAVHIGIPAAGPYQEVSIVAALGLGPALEGVTRAGLGVKDINTFVDLDAGV